MIWVIIIIATFALDRITKMYITSSMTLGQSHVVIDKFFYITYWENKGAAWGIFQNGRYFFIPVTTVVTLILTYVLFKSDNKVLKTSLALIIGGAIGNLVDRIFRGSVTDFLDFYFGSYEFPIFNLADSFVVVGTFLLAYYLLFVYKEDEKVSKEK